jgi:hypothetical protein
MRDKSSRIFKISTSLMTDEGGAICSPPPKALFRISHNGSNASCGKSGGTGLQQSARPFIPDAALADKDPMSRSKSKNASKPLSFA